jgi:SAM-dependent methyltransferase
LGDTKSKCESCGRVYAHSPTHYNFLTAEHQTECEIVSTDHVAANEYDEVATRIIEDNQNGLILDCGSGSHRREYANVFYYEVVAYPSTDVLGVGEHLPFRDQTFDAVFSLNVLEHVADPLRCAAEITRVLKSGGALYCVVPFLQPLHGYPNHFYNMSGQGLRHLFESSFDIVQHGVPLSGVPIWTLNWILRSWANGLPQKAKVDFLNMRVSDLVADTPLDYLDRPFVTQLPAEKNLELASTTMIIAKKY